MSPSIEQHTTAGHGSGWSVHLAPDGRWAWSAYGLRGGAQGVATTREQAEERAQAAERDVAKPWHTVPGTRRVV